MARSPGSLRVLWSIACVTGVALGEQRGVVVDEQGAPIAGASVVLTFPNVVLTATSASDGTISIDDPSVEGIPCSEIRLEARGFTTRVVRDASLRAPRLVLFAAGTIRGRLVDATTGRPVERGDVRVFMEAPCGGQQPFDPTEPDVRMEDDGAFVAGNLDRGRSYTLQCVAAGLEEVVLAGIIPLEETDLRITLGHGASISGRVSGLDGSPLPGALVSDATPRSMWAENTVRAPASTADDGSYHLEGLAPGRTYLLVESAGFRPQECPVDLDDGESATRVFSLRPDPGPWPITRQRTVTLRGIVTRAGTPVIRGSIGEDELTDAPRPGLPITDGVFEIPGLRPGLRDVFVAPSDGLSEVKAIVVPQDDGAFVPIELASGVVRGLLRESGRPASPGLEVTLERRCCRRATSMDDGSFEIDGVPPGDDTLLVAEPSATCGRDLPRAAVKFSISSGEVLDMEIDVSPVAADLVTLSGAVSLPGGGAAFPTVVSIRGKHGEEVADAVTDGAGRYCISGFAPGTYDVVANESRNFFWPAVRGFGVTLRRAVDVRTSTELDLVLAIGATLDVTVCADGLPLEGAWVEPVLPGIWRQRTGEDGEVQFRGLPEGDAVIRVRAGDARRDVSVHLSRAGAAHIDVPWPAP